MNILLDTCAILWSVLDPEKLGMPARTAMLNPGAEVYVSPLSCAEIACLIQRGRLVLDRHWRTWFDYFIDLNGWRLIDIDLGIVQEAYSLPGDFHQDPVDRILTATARIHRLTLVTGDRKLIDYPHVATLS